MDMYTGTLIEDLFAIVERVQKADRLPTRTGVDSKPSGTGVEADVRHVVRRLEPEQFPQPLSLRAAHGNLGLLLVVHA